jgi:hypothetical protein
VKPDAESIAATADEVSKLIGSNQSSVDGTNQSIAIKIQSDHGHSPFWNRIIH